MSLILLPSNETESNNQEGEVDIVRSYNEDAGHILAPLLNALGISVQAVISEVSDKDTRFELWDAAQLRPNVMQHRQDIDDNRNNGGFLWTRSQSTPF